MGNWVLKKTELNLTTNLLWNKDNISRPTGAIIINSWGKCGNRSHFVHTDILELYG